MTTSPVVVGLADPRVEVRGAAWLEATADGLLPHRLPAWTRDQQPDDFMRMCDEQPAGVRLRFRTAARRLALVVRVHRGTLSPDSDATVPGEPFDLVVDGQVAARAAAGAAGPLVLDPLLRTTRTGAAPVTRVAFDLAADGPPSAGAVRDVEVWLPYRERVHLLALEAEAPVEAPAPVAAPRWVHHGSSISHGASAASPTGTWPVVAAATAGLDLVNLGFSGNAVLDPFVARTIRDAPAGLISLKLGINVVNGDTMRRRAFAPAVDGFLDTVREGHPTTPLLVVSPILCPMVEDVPGPTRIDPAAPPGAPVFETLGRTEEVAEGKLSLGAIREVLASVVERRRAAGDTALAYLDGRELYGWDDWAELPMADLLHPDPPAHRRMGERFADVARGLLAGRRAGVTASA
ncbi:SGNH/GDSL hydrolase family protein [Cellulomonas endophytica]|uniref:SGNH/GDSL hydrolase family protein n=1 Tax=Cellulomonas endophytica TaxID=2494735 RepID=UPI00196A6DE0|nr:SGNH/GDSL hydrolase family protein [Cellulomonas endophytica]